MNIIATAVLICSFKPGNKASNLLAVHALHQQQIQYLKENITME